MAVDQDNAPPPNTDIPEPPTGGAAAPARNWTLRWSAREMESNSPSSGAAPSVTPDTLRPSMAFDKDTDESTILTGKRIPVEHTGTGTIKLTLTYAASTTTAADDVRWDVVGECLAANNNESTNADSFGATADSATGTFGTTAWADREVTITLTNFKADEAPVAGDLFRLKVTRDANHATDDSLAEDCHLLAAEMWEEP